MLHFYPSGYVFFHPHSDLNGPVLNMRRLETEHPIIVVVFFLAFGFFCLVSPVTEREILLQFRGNVSVDPYNSLSSWDPSRNPCSDYSGIFCDSNGNVYKIVLWNTSLGGVLSPSLSELKSLRILSLFGNHFFGNIPPEYSLIDSLWKINLSSNALSGSIPDFLGDLPNIRFLDLSRNAFTGEIPENLFSKCYKTKFISLARNNISGSIPLSIGNCLELNGIDLSFNILNGEMPSQICDIPGLTYLSLSGNLLTGNVEERVTNCEILELLDLGGNMFTGLAPFRVLELQNLTYFNVSHNRFQGEITYTESCNERLEIFDASDNDMFGEIPLSITRCTGLKLLNLAFNKLNGSVPIELAQLRRISVIRLGENSLTGSVPVEFGRIEYLRVLDLHNLNLDGEIPITLSHCRFLLELNLSGNNIVGEIPETLHNMSYLEVLDLHSNRLNGLIPSTLGNLSRIQILDLSQNSLSGLIPFSLISLSNLTYFNLSNNNLSGQIPLSPTIDKFGPTAFLNNPLLCGAPLTTRCTANGTVARPRLLSVSAIIAIVAAAVILAGVVLVTIFNMKARKTRREEETFVVESTPLGSTDTNLNIGKLVLFSKSLPSRYEDWESGTKALLDKKSLVGRGSIGSTYRTSFEGGISIAVKKLETIGRMRNQDEFEHEIGRLGSFRHKNLVALQGYYWSSNLTLILSEFIPNGNLYENLHGLNYPGTSTNVGNPELTWDRRFQIGLGTARALMYLHHDCKPQVLHLNIKSTNILLDENYEPKLSDYGLGKMLPILDNSLRTRSHNAVGYIPPELAQSLRISDKCDVYSFGVILLELVTGRKPVETPSANEVVVLCEYVRGMIERGSGSDCFDGSLRGFQENELIQVMKLGLICTNESPSRRPGISEVVQVLESIRS